MPDDLRSQFGLVRRILAAHRIPIVEIEGQEADDVIATLARQAEEAGEQTVVVTGDLDLLQIVDDRTTVLDDAPRDYRSRPLRSRGGARTLRIGAGAAAGLSRAQGRSVR